MSTYTDVKNRVRENVSVGYLPDDRITIQKVKFHNEENEYWGTFNGKLSVDDMQVTGGVLNDVSIYNGYLEDPVIADSEGSEIKVTDLVDSVNQLSSVAIPALSTKIDSLSGITNEKIGQALVDAETFSTILSGADAGVIADHANLIDIVSVLLDIKKIFARLSA